MPPHCPGEPCAQSMHQYFCLLRQSEFWVGFFFFGWLLGLFKIYLEIAVASASAHRVGGKKKKITFGQY